MKQCDEKGGVLGSSELQVIFIVGPQDKLKIRLRPQALHLLQLQQVSDVRQVCLQRHT